MRHAANAVTASDATGGPAVAGVTVAPLAGPAARVVVRALVVAPDEVVPLDPPGARGADPLGGPDAPATPGADPASDAPEATPSDGAARG